MMCFSNANSQSGKMLDIIHALLFAMYSTCNFFDILKKWVFKLFLLQTREASLTHQHCIQESLRHLPLILATKALLTFKRKCFIQHAVIKYPVSPILKNPWVDSLPIRQVMLIQANQTSFLAIPLV
jgi:hypothetical protein